MRTIRINGELIVGDQLSAPLVLANPRSGSTPRILASGRSSRPFTKTPVRRGRKTDTGGVQRLPLRARAQQQEDGFHGGLIR